MPSGENDQEMKEAFTDLALEIESIIDRNRIVNWVDNNDIHNRMRNEVEDLIFEWNEKVGIVISFDQIDRILEQCIDVARVRLP